MNILIVEDETLAANRLISLLKKIDSSITIVGTVDSNRELAHWLTRESMPDLIFSDIELLDGPVFNTLNNTSPACPVIFTTAYDHFVQDAFKQNGIEYLLKPFDVDRLQAALNKYHRLKTNMAAITPEVISLIKQQLQPEQKQFRTRFTIKRHQGIQLLDAKNIVLFKLDQTGLFAYDEEKNYYPMHDYTLNALESELDPAMFFRVNRNEIVSIKYIAFIKSYSKDRLAIDLQNIEQPCITSSHRTPEFRKWLNAS